MAAFAGTHEESVERIGQLEEIVTDLRGKLKKE